MLTLAVYTNLFFLKTYFSPNIDNVHKCFNFYTWQNYLFTKTFYGSANPITSFNFLNFVITCRTLKTPVEAIQIVESTPLALLKWKIWF